MDKSIQNSEVVGILGYLEHTGVMKQLLREVKEKKGDLVTVLVEPGKHI